MAQETRSNLRLLRRLAQIGIAVFLLISAFDIHRWRREPWQAFDTMFARSAIDIFGQPPSPLWLYALAFPIVAINFGCLVQIVRRRVRELWLPFTASSVAIALMPLAGGQFAVNYRIIWADILTLIGYGIGGAIALFLYTYRSGWPETQTKDL